VLLAAASSASTTTVPTWLAVLVPLATVVAALMAGAAALLGVWLGGRAARVTAEHTAALAREDEFRRWKRERRYAAYVDLLRAVDRHRQAIDELARILKRLVAEGTGSADPPEDIKRQMEEAAQQLEASGNEIGNVFPHVLVVGSSEARQAIDGWARRLKAVNAAAIAKDWEALERARTDARLSRNALVDVIREELEVHG
jgi:hypothetical protein